MSKKIARGHTLAARRRRPQNQKMRATRSAGDNLLHSGVLPECLLARSTSPSSRYSLIMSSPSFSFLSPSPPHIPYHLHNAHMCPLVPFAASLERSCVAASSSTSCDCLSVRASGALAQPLACAAEQVCLPASACRRVATHAGPAAASSPRAQQL